MATPGRSDDAAVERWPIADMLDREPYRFEFFQAVRLLERLFPGRRPVGGFGDPHDEVAHFSARPVIAFPPSEVHAIELPGDRPARIRPHVAHACPGRSRARPHLH